MSHDSTRRDFLRSAVAAAAVAAVNTKLVNAAARTGAPERESQSGSRIRVGFIGFGVRGRELHGGFLADPDVDIVRVADVSLARAQEGVRLINEKRGPDSCRISSNWRDLIADPEVDAVVIATPDHWHAEPAIAACLAGRHVYCEKPMSLTIAEGRAMADAARSSGVKFQVGSQQRSEFSHFFALAAQAVRNNRIGSIRRITIGVGQPPIACDLPGEPLPDGIDWDSWIGQAPTREFNAILCPIGMHNHYPAWRAYREYCNGYLADMGAHHFDIAQWALKMDESGPTGIFPPSDGAQTGLRFIYESGVEMVHGGPTDCTFEGSGGVIECSRGHIKAMKDGVEALQLLAGPTGDEERVVRNTSHIGDFLQAIRSGGDPICTAETGHRTASICQLAVIGYQVGKPMTWDPRRERFVGENAQAGNQLLARPVRKHA